MRQLVNKDKVPSRLRPALVRQIGKSPRWQDVGAATRRKTRSSATTAVPTIGLDPERALRSQGNTRAWVWNGICKFRSPTRDYHLQRREQDGLPALRSEEIMNTLRTALASVALICLAIVAEGA